jgi:putative metallohydrolase (TIGR04338 family)
VYDWENREFNGKDADGPLPTMTLDEMQQLADRVRRDYGVKSRIEVRDGRGRRRACYSPGLNAIKMPRWSRKRWCVLHELAHAIEYLKWPGRAAWHGREFVGIYMELLRRYDGRKLAAMTRSANEAGVDFLPNSQCTARYLKKRGLRN